MAQHHGAEKVVESAKPRANSEMNITPLIDVLLVLLIIFMVTLPLNQRGIDIDLPAETGPPNAAPSHQIVLEYTNDKRMSIKNPVPFSKEIACLNLCVPSEGLRVFMSRL